MFPRYNVVDAIRVDIERLDPDDLPSLPVLMQALKRSGETAQSILTQPPSSDIAADAMRQERHRFEAFLDSWSRSPTAESQPLAYRRVLSTEEALAWWTRVAQRWDVTAKSWYPMLARPVPAEVVVLHDRAMRDGPGPAALRSALGQLGRHRVVELREYGPEYALALDLLDPGYNGAEGLWTDDTLDWIAFASHEGTIAFGGSVTPLLPTLWPDLEGARWSGW